LLASPQELKIVASSRDDPFLLLEQLAMLDQPSLEQRLSSLEHEVDEIKQRLARRPSNGNWVAARSGSMKDFPEFEEVVRLGREARRSFDETSQ
jgi:hypothetical protein